VRRGIEHSSVGTSRETTDDEQAVEQAVEQVVEQPADATIFVA